MFELLTTLLLISPWDISPILPQYAPEPCWTALKGVAHNAELSGPQCHWIADYRREYIWTWHHLREHVRDPHLWECSRLPPLSLCEQNVRILRERIRYLERVYVLRLHWRARLDPYLDQSRQMLLFWEEACGAHNDTRPWYARRRALYTMRALLTEDAWYGGNWPFPVLP